MLDNQAIFGVLAAITGIITAIIGGELSINIVRIFSKKGPKPKKRPAYIWVIFICSLIATIIFGTYAKFGTFKDPEINDLEYMGYVVNSADEPIEGARVILTINNTTKVVYTNSEGMYRFVLPAEAPLKGQIEVSAKDYPFFSREVNFETGMETAAIITLTQKDIITHEREQPNKETEESPTPRATETSNWATISCDVPQASLRNSPGYIDKNDSIDVLVIIDCGQRVKLLGENQIADDITWWRISWNGYTGWMADHTGSGKLILIFN